MKAYIYTLLPSYDTSDIDAEIQTYVHAHHFEDVSIIEDNADLRLHWTQRKLSQVIDGLQSNEHFIVYSALSLASTAMEVLEILIACQQKNINLHFVKYDLNVLMAPVCKARLLIKLMQAIENEFIAKRTAEALARGQENKLALGRPKGSKNKALKLDKHRAEIERYLALKVSKASIAKLLSCHPQTLYDWLARNGYESTPVALRKMQNIEA